jgi:hypothetical protein
MGLGSNELQLLGVCLFAIDEGERALNHLLIDAVEISLIISHRAALVIAESMMPVCSLALCGRRFSP